MKWSCRILVAVLALLACAGGLAGCTSARNLLGNAQSQCFRVLPVAHDAVGRSAVFAGVRRLPGTDLVDAIEHSGRSHPAPPDALADVARRTACLVAYKGKFTVAGVRDGWAASPGRYRGAVVVMDLSNDTVVVTVLFTTVPHSIEFLHRLSFLS